ncbi:acyl-CoA dehydrogenase family protein [Rhizobiales bacterium]|uniref:acyl-CoA dehydrogenase family protein n=1 Tax=Hongsoonwoonella zoysiae TaxID=2821844 RepID=UPI001561AA56|nr:acyl-CoA dehydrogenase family protein [Hongsoonwoonella zoysiae]NRG19162.1 acyl-CoA dehydrogenase family protein [Hongsoonwoonella zoysiae]
MPASTPAGERFRTHEVTNQPSPYVGYNLFDGDPLLIAALGNMLDETAEGELSALGRFWGSNEAQEFGRLANKHPPVLHTHDAYGNRLETVDFHPAYHALMRRSAEAGLHMAMVDDDETRNGRRHSLRAAAFYVTTQTDAGHLCPLTMTNAAGAVLRHEATVAQEWLPRIRARKYDHRFRPASEKMGVTLGMGFTEKQGGTDLRRITTVAEPVEDGSYRVTGHKWFFSAPMSDAFVVLAKTAEGPTAFLLPRFRPDGTVNEIRVRRLKNKLGNHSNASSEVEFEHAYAQRIGPEGAGIRTVIDMITPTRIDCAVGSAGLMRAAAARAVHHVRERVAFGGALIDQPLMLRVIGDMSLDVAAATALVVRLARAMDRAAESEPDAAYLRLMTPAVKYWVCKIAPSLIYEAMECLGGNGYTEDFDLARLYREAPVNAIWEGSGNVMALDVVRALGREAETLDLVLEEIEKTLGATGPVSINVLRAAAKACVDDPGSSRILTEQLALTGAAAALREVAPAVLSDAFIESRLAGQWRSTYGMLDARFDLKGLVDWLYPQKR